MTLDRERSMAAVAASSAAMSTESAIARAAIRSESASGRAELAQRLAVLENEFRHLKDQVNAR
jgi:hypothetical protein